MPLSGRAETLAESSIIHVIDGPTTAKLREPLAAILVGRIIIMTNSAYILQQYVPERPELTYNLRERSHKDHAV